MKQWRGSWCTCPAVCHGHGCSVELGFQEGLLALATWSWGAISLHPFPLRETSGTSSRFST